MTEAERFLDEKLRRGVQAGETAARPAGLPGTAAGAARAGWFTAEGRLNRMSFFLRMLALFPVYVAAVSMSRFGAKEWGPIALIMIIAVCVMQILQTIKRLHDFGMSGWLVLVLQVPAAIAEVWKMLFWTSKMGATSLITVGVICAGLSLVGTLWVQFAPGTAGPNRFGLQPI